MALSRLAVPTVGVILVLTMTLMTYTFSFLYIRMLIKNFISLYTAIFTVAFEKIKEY